MSWLCHAPHGHQIDFGRILWGQANEYPQEILLHDGGNPANFTDVSGGQIASKEQRTDMPIREEYDPIAADVFGGISRRALAQARDDRSSATTQYEQAVRQARANGWTWAEIGRILGVSRQVLHRRFRQRPPD